MVVGAAVVVVVVGAAVVVVVVGAAVVVVVGSATRVITIPEDGSVGAAVVVVVLVVVGAAVVVVVVAPIGVAEKTVLGADSSPVQFAPEKAVNITFTTCVAPRVSPPIMLSRCEEVPATGMLSPSA